MNNTVFCQKYQQQLEALAEPPFPGDLGLQIQKSISKKAWNNWLQLQTMLINEKHLNLASFDDRKYLNQQRQLFFEGEQYEKPSGYTPPQ